MAEPTSSAALGLPALGAATLFGIMTGLDYWTLLGGVAGALLALRAQERQGAGWAVLGLVCVAFMSLFATWFVVDTLPAIAKAVGASGFSGLGLGRTFISFLVGYYAQSVILPAGGRAIASLFARLGGAPANEEGKP